mmetsp:Transcript_94116/g.263470  ORF Transcript_94116/g.263470 Transcript_94116/m.263470 type:complete len:204 (-) Transcript_94116:820-1431(-)
MLEAHMLPLSLRGSEGVVGHRRCSAAASHAHRSAFAEHGGAHRRLLLDVLPAPLQHEALQLQTPLRRQLLSLLRRLLGRKSLAARHDAAVLRLLLLPLQARLLLVDVAGAPGVEEAVQHAVRRSSLGVGVFGVPTLEVGRAGLLNLTLLVLLARRRARLRDGRLLRLLLAVVGRGVRLAMLEAHMLLLSLRGAAQGALGRLLR